MLAGPFEGNAILRHIEQLAAATLAGSGHLDADVDQAEIGAQVAIRTIKDVSARTAVELHVIERRWLRSARARPRELVTERRFAFAARFDRRGRIGGFPPASFFCEGGLIR